MQEKEEILTKLKGWDEEIAWKKYAAAVLQHSGEKNGGVKCKSTRKNGRWWGGDSCFGGHSQREV